MEIIDIAQCPEFVSQDNAIVQEIVSHRNSSVKNQSLAKVTINPGQSVLEHYHVRTEELYHILQGEGLMHIDGEEQFIGVGQTVVILPGQKHKVHNKSDDALVMLVMCAPGYEDDDQVLV